MFTPFFFFFFRNHRELELAAFPFRDSVLLRTAQSPEADSDAAWHCTAYLQRSAIYSSALYYRGRVDALVCVSPELSDLQMFLETSSLIGKRPHGCDTVGTPPVTGRDGTRDQTKFR